MLFSRIFSCIASLCAALAICAAVISLVTLHWMVHDHNKDAEMSPKEYVYFAYIHIFNGLGWLKESTRTGTSSTASSWVTFIGLLCAKECVGGHECKKVQLRGTGYYSYERAGKVAFILIVLGTVFLLPAFVYFVLNSFRKRLERSTVHHCLRLQALSAAALFCTAWGCWVVIVRHSQGFHIGFSFVLAVAATALSILAYIFSVLVKEDLDNNHYAALQQSS
ncbi:hypothetical protein Pelo_6187 [Pelomyxa schiedti]|nr:hypothetical protein Pelo_6187 [Pelomyxa schiedti]